MRAVPTACKTPTAEHSAAPRSDATALVVPKAQSSLLQQPLLADSFVGFTEGE
jgi:hypothetical protein